MSIKEEKQVMILKKLNKKKLKTKQQPYLIFGKIYNQEYFSKKKI